MARSVACESVGIIILASGQAKRMGQNKLLMPIGSGHEPCVRRLAKVFAEWFPGQVLVVYQDEAVKDVLADLPLRLAHNSKAVLGQSEAIKLGISQPWESTIQAFAFVMGDQPLLTTEVLCRLVEAFWREGADMAVPRVGTVSYSPVVFHRKWTAELLKLSGDKGAKGLLKYPDAKVVYVPFENCDIFADIDTPEAYESIQRKLASLENGG